MSDNKPHKQWQQIYVANRNIVKHIRDEESRRWTFHSAVPIRINGDPEFEVFLLLFYKYVEVEFVGDLTWEIDLKNNSNYSTSEGCEAEHRDYLMDRVGRFLKKLSSRMKR